MWSYRLKRDNLTIARGDVPEQDRDVLLKEVISYFFLYTDMNFEKVELKLSHKKENKKEEK